MSEPRYQTRVGDPDQTTRIPREALDELRDADRAKEGTPPGGPSTGPTPAQSRPAEARPGGGGNGSTPTPRNGTGPASGPTPAVSAPDGRPAFPGGTNGSAGNPALGTNGSGPGPGGATAAGMNGSGANGSATGYRRSETGYSPAAYPNSYGSQFTSLGDAPTTVTGPGTAGVGLGTGAAAGTAAARSALGAATTPRPGTTRPSGGPARPARPARRARLLVRHIDPWSTLKFSAVLSVAMFFVWLVAIGVLYIVLDGMGVFEQVNSLYGEISGDGGDSLFSPGLVLGIASVIGVVNIVLFTALATIGAFVYNICADLVGGIEVTLAERD